MFKNLMNNAKSMVNNAKDGLDTSAKVREKKIKINEQDQIINDNIKAMGEFVIKSIETKFDDIYSMTRGELEYNVGKFVGENSDPYYIDLIMSVFDAKVQKIKLERELEEVKNEAELKKQEMMANLNDNKDEAVDYLKQTFGTKDKNKEKEKEIVEQYLAGDITIEELRFLMKHVED